MHVHMDRGPDLEGEQFKSKITDCVEIKQEWLRGKKIFNICYIFFLIKKFFSVDTDSETQERAAQDHFVQRKKKHTRGSRILRV